jgi:deoxyhypusine synthase
MSSPLKNVLYLTVLGDFLGLYITTTSTGQEFLNPYNGSIKIIQPKFVVEREQTERPRINRIYNVRIQEEEYMLEFEGRSLPPDSTVIYYHFKGFDPISSNHCDVLRWIG